MARNLLVLVAVMAMLGAGAPVRAAFPEKDITFVVPYAPGGTFDTYVRAISAALERHLPNKVHVIPTNNPGGDGAKAVGTIWRTKPDGYTIAIFDIPGELLPQIANNPPPAYDLRKMTWLASAGADPYGIAVTGKSPIQTLDDMKKLGRPVKVTSTGPGTSSYLVAHIVMDVLGIPMSSISGYRGSSEYVIGAIRGDGDGTVAVIPQLLKFRDSGDLRTIAVMAPKSPFPGVVDATAMGQPDLGKLAIRRLIGAPPGLPENIRKILEDSLMEAMADPETIKIMQTAGADMLPERGDKAAAYLNDSIDLYTRYRKYILE